MVERRQLIPILGILATMAFALYMVAQMNGQESQITGDFSNATIAEVRNAQGQIVLQGQFEPAEEEDDEVERRATLQPTGIDPDAEGDAEVEFSKSDPGEQEIEFSVRNLDPGASFTFVLDGSEVATVRVNNRGRAEVELTAKGTGTAGSR
jgi:hypothetical protein